MAAAAVEPQSLVRGPYSPPKPTPDEAPEQAPAVFKTSQEPLFRNGSFAIARSETAGWGAFATRPLRLGDVILRERPLMVANRCSLFTEFDKLGASARQLALSLHANELVKPGTPRILAVWVTNCFTTGGSQAGLFPVAARFNHACCPAHNIDFRYNNESDCLELVVKADRVAPGDELRISYGRDRTAAELYMTYGFRCRCGACLGLSDAELSTLTSQW